MRSTSKVLLAAAACTLALGCAGKDGGEQPVDTEFEALAACAATRLPNVGEFLYGLLPCLHEVDTHHDHASCAFTAIECTPDPGTIPTDACPNGAGTVGFDVSYGKVVATIRPGLWTGMGGSFSQCWDGLGTGESCGLDWRVTGQGSQNPAAVEANGFMGFVELSPDAHHTGAVSYEPEFQANNCLIRLTSLSAYVHLGNLIPPPAPVIYDGMIQFEVPLQVPYTPQTEWLTGMAFFTDACSTVNVDLTFRGTTRKGRLDCKTFALTW